MLFKGLVFTSDVPFRSLFTFRELSLYVDLISSKSCFVTKMNSVRKFSIDI